MEKSPPSKLQAEYFITSWVVVENIINLMFLASADLLDDKDSLEKAKRRTFEYKTKFLKEKNLLNPRQYAEIRRLNDLRDTVLYGESKVRSSLLDSDDNVREITLQGLKALLEAYVKFVERKTL